MKRLKALFNKVNFQIKKLKKKLRNCIGNVDYKMTYSLI